MKTKREQVLEYYGLEDRGYSIPELSEISGYSEDVLQQVYRRGLGAYKTNPLSVRMKSSYRKGIRAPMSQKLSAPQWAQSRVWSFISGNPKHDSDLR